MSTTNITGDRLVSKIPTTEYRANYAKILGPKPNIELIEPVEEEELERCSYCGIMSTNPCYSLPPSYCERALNVTYGDPTK